MFGFSKKITGIDIGPGRIRAVRLRPVAAGRHVVEGYAENPLPEGVLLPSYTKENVADMKRFTDVLRLTLGTAGVMKGEVAVSIPDQVVKVSFIELKGVSRKRDEVLKFIRWKSKKFLPYDPEGAKIDYYVMGEGDMAMAAFIKEEIVSNYEEALLSLSFRPNTVSIQSLSLFNLFVDRFKDAKDFAFVSVEEDAFSVVIVKGGAVDFHRSRDVGFSDGRLMQEIASSILFYTSEHQDVRIGKIFMHASAADNEAIRANLADTTGIDVEMLALTGMIDGPKGLYIEPYAAAIGAALHGVR